MTRELAVEYAGVGIRVNAIAPAQVATETFKRGMLGDPRFNSTLRQRLMAGIPLNRFLEPEDFVGPAVFLCSAAAAAVTGVILPVDGGNLALNAGGNHIGRQISVCDGVQRHIVPVDSFANPPQSQRMTRQKSRG